MDKEKTFVNAQAAISLEKAAIPMHFDSDRECLAACLAGCGLVSFRAASVVRIQDTKTLDRFYVSRALEDQVTAHPGLALVSDWAAVEWDEQGNWKDPH